MQLCSVWTTKHQKAFKRIQEMLVSLAGDSLIIHLPDITRKFDIICEVSKIAIVSILLHKDNQKHFYIICYSPHLLNAAPHNYTTSERECLAIVHVMCEWHEYSSDQLLIIYSDHKVLEPISTRALRLTANSYSGCACCQTSTSSQIPDKLRPSDVLSHLIDVGTSNTIACIIF